jgi:hypothetical protein
MSEYAMNYVTSASTGVKPFGDSPGERDLVLSALRVASAEARLVANTLDTIGASLRQKAITCEGALQWAAEEDLIHLLRFGPSEPKAAIHWRSPSWQRARDEYHAARRAKQ